MENPEIAKIFHEIADLLEIKGENPFRVRSYRNAALVIEGLPASIESIAEKDEKRVEDIPGIGRSIHEKIMEILKTGTCKLHEELLVELPSGLLELLKISGIGAKRAGRLYKELGIKNARDLEMAVKAGKLRGLAGMGEKTEVKLLKAIGDYKNLKKTSGRMRLSVAYPHAMRYVDYIKEKSGARDVQVAGSLRRWKDTIGDVDILATCRQAQDMQDMVEHFVNYPQIKEVVQKGDTKATVLLKTGLQVDLRVLDKKSFGSALQYFTGSKSHNILIRDMAKKKKLKINEYGVFSETTGKMVAGEKEEDVYAAIGLEWIPPELRENRGEIEAAEKGKTPRLLEQHDIKGDLHVHTPYSDGMSPLDSIASAAIEMGYDYVAATDHSKAVGIAHGLDEKRLLKEMDEIDLFNEKLERKGVGFRVLKGTEVDIKADGSLDYVEGVLRKLDCVVGAVHSRFDMTKDEMTKRITRAMSTGCVDILAHPTGRLIGIREPYEVDMEILVESAKRYGVIMELNSYPERLDLNDIHCRLAKDNGVLIAISTDSHSHLQLEHMVYGVHTARRGWLEKKDVINTRALKELVEIIKKRRR